MKTRETMQRCKDHTWSPPPAHMCVTTFKVPGDELAILLAAKEVIDCLQVEFSSVKLLPWKTQEVATLTNS